MDSRAIFDQLLKSGQDLMSKGQGMAEKELKIPEAGPEREAMFKGLGKGAAVGGALALLLGTKLGRTITGPALKLGSVAALGGLAYQAYQDWQSKQGAIAPAVGTSIDKLTGQAAEQRSLALLKAMIAAAKADGHIDAGERARIEGQMQALTLDSDTLQFFKDELAKPLSVKDIAAGADSPSAAAEIYLTSLVVIDEQNAKERAYLQELAKELKLSQELVAGLESQAKA